VSIEDFDTDRACNITMEYTVERVQQLNRLGFGSLPDTYSYGARKLQASQERDVMEHRIKATASDWGPFGRLLETSINANLDTIDAEPDTWAKNYMMHGEMNLRGLVKAACLERFRIAKRVAQR